jgi:glycosyltransferase involved in cell wall biosynthesis
MKPARLVGLFVLGNPIIVGDGVAFLRDKCYAETFRHASATIHSCLVVARTRPQVGGLTGMVRLSDANAELALTLPDYGTGGCRGFVCGLNLLLNPTLRNALAELVDRSDFVYVEGGTSIETFLTAQIAKRQKKRLILEMRGSTVLNSQYLCHRFGSTGILLLPLHQAILSFVRKQCSAGLYINRDLMKCYPVAGTLNQAISDAYLPDVIGMPRRFTQPAHRYLYVGHLEIVKRVDLIISALALAQETLPQDWHLDVVGSGPLESELKTMTEKLALGNHITFHGRLEWGESLFQVYRQADLSLMASITEGASRTLIESMLFGLPVISTAVGNAPEILDRSVLVPVGTTEAYAKCLTELVNDTVRLTRFSACNWRNAQDYRRPVLESKRREFWKQAIEECRGERVNNRGES